MKSRIFIAQKLLCVALTALLLKALPTKANTYVWTNVVGGNWNLAANWSPNAVPGAGDTANITTAGTYAVTLNVAATVTSLTVGGAGSGVQTLQVNGFNLAATNALINSGGILGLSSSTFTGTLSVSSGGEISANGAALDADVTVENGGEIMLVGSGSTIGQAGDASDTNYWLWVRSGGVVNDAGSGALYLFGTLTNSGVINVTNGINVQNNGTPSYYGGLVNQAGGVIDLWNNANINGQDGYDYLVNQGTINLSGGTGTSSVALDNITNVGTMTAQAGTGELNIGYFNGLGSLTGTYNAAAGSVIAFYAYNSPGTSAGEGLTLEGTGAFRFVQGLLTLPTNVFPGLALDGGTVALGVDFQGGAITNLTVSGVSLTSALPITGTLTMANSAFSTTNTLASGASLSVNNTTIFGSITIASNGLLTANSAALDADVTVENGGEIMLVGSGSTIGQAGNASDATYWLWVQSGGVVNDASSGALYLFGVLTNSGVINVTNGINVQNNGTPNYNGGLVNQAGGVIDLWNNANIGGQGAYDYLVNQGTINMSGGTGTSSLNMDNITNLGTMTTQPGTGELNIGYFNGLGSLAGTYTAAAGSVIAFYAYNSPGTSAGAGLTLQGSGAFRFVQGLLTLPTNVYPGLALDGGSVALGAGFQGGAITNLTVSGVSLTSGLPITGTLTMANSTLYTTNTLAGGASLSLNGSTLYGSMTIASNGLLTANGSSLDADVTVENGGEIMLVGSGSTVGQAGDASDTTYWLWVRSGGVVNDSSSGALYLFGILTNSGVINVTNGINIQNNGTPNYYGGLVNQAGGVIDLWNNANIGGQGAYDYLVNQGTINMSGGTGTSSVALDNITNLGTMTTQPGTGELNIGYFNGLGSLTGTYTAAAGSVIAFYAYNSPGTSAGEGLTLEGAGAYRFVQGLLTLPTNVYPGLALDGGTVALGAGFQGGAITNLTVSGVSLTSGLPITGTLTMANSTLYTTNTLAGGASLSLNGSTLYGSMTIASNGLLTANGSSLDADVTVENGGELLLVGGGSGVGQAGDSSDTTYWLWVRSGGVVNDSSGGALYLFGILTNSGVINVTNGINIQNNGTPNYYGGLVNQAGGVIDLWNNAGIGGQGGFDYLVNQGAINLSSGTGTSSLNMDNITNLGTMTTQPGTGELNIGYFNGLGSLTGTYTAAAGSVIAFYAYNSPGTSAGEGLTLEGAGAYRFVQGLLTLPTNVYPGLALDGGTVALGAGFQGGAITNLTVSGVSLTSGLPITGTLTMANSTLYTTNTLAGGASLSLNGSTLYGSMTIASNGLLTANGSSLDADVTVENGGELLLVGGGSGVGQAGDSSDTTYWLWVRSGGVVNDSSGGALYLFGTLTNSGVINVTNGINIQNNGTPNYYGGLVNQAGGVIDLWNNAGIGGQGGFDYLVNQGAINLSSGTGTSGINIDDFTNVGTLNAQHGTLLVQGTHVILQPSETLGVGLNSAGDYGTISINSGVPSPGEFRVQLNNGFIPNVGESFNVLAYTSLPGNFSGFELPAVPVAWQPVFSSTVLTLVIQPLIALAEETNVVFNANGAPGSQSVLLSSTNLSVPVTNWMPVATNTFDAAGYYSYTNNAFLDIDKPQEFFVRKSQ